MHYTYMKKTGAALYIHSSSADITHRRQDLMVSVDVKHHVYLFTCERSKFSFFPSFLWMLSTMVTYLRKVQV